MTPALLPFEGLVQLGSTLLDDVARARAYVAARRVICVACGEDDPARLRSVHRHQDRWNVPLARLVQLGASVARLRLELARCETRCRRCHLRVIARHQMLRVVAAPSIGVVAKAATTSGGGRNPAAEDSRERAAGC